MEKIGYFILCVFIYVWGFISLILGLVIILVMSVFKLPKCILTAVIESIKEFDEILDILMEKK